MAATIAVAADTGGRARSPRSGRAGRRAGSGPQLGPSEAETFWSAFLKDPVRRGLEGVRLAIPDAREGLEGAIRRVLGATWRRCRVRWTRSAPAHVGEGQRAMPAATPRRAFLRADQASARQAWRRASTGCARTGPGSPR